MNNALTCENYAEIYAFFANMANIPTRIVRLRGTIDKVKLSGHTFAESFITEQDKWAYVDLESKKLYVHNESGNLLNAIDVFHINRIGNYEGLVAKIYDNEAIIEADYSTSSSSDQKYFNKDAYFLYELFNSGRNNKFKKLIKYISYSPSYVLYSSSSSIPFKKLFMIKLIAVYIWIITLSIVIFKFVNF